MENLRILARLPQIVKGKPAPARAVGCKTHFAEAEGLVILSRSVSQLSSIPKFKNERTMPFTRNQTEDRSELHDLVHGWGKIVTRRAFGETGPGLDLDFDAIESLAVNMAQTLTRGTIEEILRQQVQLLGDQQPCPQGSRPCPLEKAPRTVAVRGGTIDYIARQRMIPPGLATRLGRHPIRHSRHRLGNEQRSRSGSDRLDFLLDLGNLSSPKKLKTKNVTVQSPHGTEFAPRHIE